MPTPFSADTLAARKLLRESGDATVSQLCREVGIPPSSRRREYMRLSLERASDVYIDRWVRHETAGRNRHPWEAVFSILPENCPPQEDCPRPE